MEFFIGTAVAPGTLIHDNLISRPQHIKYNNIRVQVSGLRFISDLALTLGPARNSYCQYFKILNNDKHLFPGKWHRKNSYSHGTNRLHEICAFVLKLLTVTEANLNVHYYHFLYQLQLLINAIRR